MTPTGRIILVACAATKLAEPAPAAALYTSDLFTKSRAWAEREVAEGRADAWFILSAKYGLLYPNESVSPYDETLNGKSASHRVEWSTGVMLGLRHAAPAKTTVVFLAGELYRKTLATFLAQDGVRVEVPMAGLGIGEQKAWLKGSLDTPTTPVGQLAFWPTLF